jgi:hypothetical protein
MTYKKENNIKSIKADIQINALNYEQFKSIATIFYKNDDIIEWKPKNESEQLAYDSFLKK